MIILYETFALYGSRDFMSYEYDVDYWPVI